MKTEFELLMEMGELTIGVTYDGYPTEEEIEKAMKKTGAERANVVKHYLLEEGEE